MAAAGLVPRAPAFREALRLGDEELRRRFAEYHLALVECLLGLVLRRGSARHERAVVQADRLIDRRLADALDAGGDVVAVVDGVRTATALEVGALPDVPTDGGERWLAPVRVRRAAGLVLAGALFHDAPAELGPGLHDRGDRPARLFSADGSPRELGLDLRLLAPLERLGRRLHEARRGLDDGPPALDGILHGVGARACAERRNGSCRCQQRDEVPRDAT